MKFKAEIDVMPLEALLDPQGKAVLGSMGNIGISGVDDVRIGKHITLVLDAENEGAAMQKAEDACKKLLANPVMESYTVKIIPA